MFALYSLNSHMAMLVHNFFNIYNFIDVNFVVSILSL